jgi:hypothetical protein
MAIKKFNLKFIQIAWVVEVAVVILFSGICLLVLDTDRLAIWHQYLPLISGLIGTQGVAASVGPLVSDKIKKNGGAVTEGN